MFSLDHVFRALFLHVDSLVHLDLDAEAETPLPETFDPTPGQYFFDNSNERSPRYQLNYQKEWVDELQEPQVEQGGQPSPWSLRAGQLDDASFAIVDHLPPSLEALCIYGYEKGMKLHVEGLPDDVFDRQLEKLLAEKNTQLPRLTYIEGIDELIENVTIVKNPATNDEALCPTQTALVLPILVDDIPALNM
ncbi:hypothetical protein N7463_003845 [Penicillium fimorum]|uniref:Uncharacterized protein n=1 Tax=Penicillium fimorum TaxID=1882269 RepID=A0A9X0C9N7_9EURO|nr:hypothetical protein N7463_003845 [Penicillium fimorum]